MDNLDVSIIILNQNSKDALKGCLNSVYKKITGLKFEIVVVDNASKDDSLEMLRNDFPYVQTIKLEKATKPTEAYNTAISQSQAKYVFLLNSDTILINNSIKTLFDFMEEPLNSATGACGGILFNQDDGMIKSFTFFPKIKNMLINHTFLKYIFPNVRKRYKNYETTFPDKPSRVDCISIADLMLRKSVLDEVGLFDEDFVLSHSEIELQFRIKKAGYDVYFIPQSKIYYLEQRAIKKPLLLKATYLYFRKIRGILGEIVVRILFLPLHIKFVIANNFKAKNKKQFVI